MNRQLNRLVTTTMNISIKKLTTHDAFESIWHDYLYSNLNSNAPWLLSQDIQDAQALVSMELVEQFVESVAKSVFSFWVLKL